MKRRMINVFAKAIIAFHFACVVSCASAAEPNPIADCIKYEAKVNKLIPDAPDDGVDVAQIVEAQQAYAELLIESANQKLQLAYIRQSIIGNLEMIPFADWDVTLERCEKEIDDHSSNSASAPSLGDYVRLKGQLSAAYADVFKAEFGMSYSPKVEDMVTRLGNQKH